MQIENILMGPVRIIERYQCSICLAVKDVESPYLTTGCIMEFLRGPNKYGEPSGKVWVPLGNGWVCGEHDVKIIIDGEEDPRNRLDWQGNVIDSGDGNAG